MSYTSIHDAWNNNYISTQYNNKIVEKMTSAPDIEINNQKCECDKLIYHIINCKKCHEKLINFVNINNKSQNNFKNEYDNLFTNVSKIINKNKDIITLICIILFILLIFNLINNIIKN
jgi:hypothetical protein